MSGSSSGSNGGSDWTRFWAEAQEQAWNSWRSMFQQQSKTYAGDPNQLWILWSDGLEKLWNGRAIQLNGTHREVFTRLLDQSKGFFFLSHQMLKAFEQMQQAFDSGGDWKPILRQYVNQAQEQLRQWSGVSTGQAALWGLPVEMWERLSAALALTPGDWTQAMKGGGWPGEGFGKQAGEWLSEWPALGITREWQLRAQEGAKRSEQCQDSWNAYTAKLVEVGVLALEYLYERLVEAGETGKPLASLSELYDLWVDCAEKAYSEVVATPEFAQTQAQLVNSAVRLKQHLQEALERAANASNLPTRQELDAAHQAIKKLQLELDEVREQLKKQKKPARTKKRGGGA